MSILSKPFHTTYKELKQDIIRRPYAIYEPFHTTYKELKPIVKT